MDYGSRSQQANPNKRKRKSSSLVKVDERRAMLDLKCYYDENLISSLSQKRFLFSLSEVAVPVSVIEMNFSALSVKILSLKM